MNWKIIGYIGAGLLILALTIGIGVKMTQKTEGYKGGNFFTFEPHMGMIGGCANYNIPKDFNINSNRASVPVKK
jgi:hypothetical protein